MDLRGYGGGAAVSGAWLGFIDFGLRTGYSLLATDQCNEDDSFWFIGAYIFWGLVKDFWCLVFMGVS